MSKIISTIIMTAFPIVIFIMSYLASPAYFEPMFKQPAGIAMLVIGLIWLAIGAVMLMITSGWRRGLVCTLFMTPVILMVMLGPAILTIATALGPVLESE